MFVDVLVQQNARLPWTLIPVQLSVEAGQLSLLKTADMILRRGEYWLDLFNIHVPKDTLELTSFLIQVHLSPHAKIEEHPQNRPIDRKKQVLFSFFSSFSFLFFSLLSTCIT